MILLLNHLRFDNVKILKDLKVFDIILMFFTLDVENKVFRFFFKFIKYSQTENIKRGLYC